MIKINLDPSIEDNIRNHIGDRQIVEINVNIYGIYVLYYLDDNSHLGEVEINWDEME